MKDFTGYTFCFLGLSGSGKDTVANFLIDFLKKNNLHKSNLKKLILFKKKSFKTLQKKWFVVIVEREDHLEEKEESEDQELEEVEEHLIQEEEDVEEEEDIDDK